VGAASAVEVEVKLAGSMRVAVRWNGMGWGWEGWGCVMVLTCPSCKPTYVLLYLELVGRPRHG